MPASKTSPVESATRGGRSNVALPAADATLLRARCCGSFADTIRLLWNRSRDGRRTRVLSCSRLAETLDHLAEGR